MDTLSVQFDRTRWAAESDEDGLQWGIYVVRHNREKTIIKGKLDPAICQFDMCFDVVGRWVNDHKYGKQFNFTSYTRTHPNGKWGTMAFLMQADGIGEITAEKIYDKYGEESIDTLLKRPYDVANGIGINPNTAKAAADALAPILGEMKVKMPLLDLFKDTRIAKRTVDRIIKARWSDPVTRIKANPFILTVFSGIAFRQCDGLRVKLGLPKDMPERIIAACEQSFIDTSDQTWLTRKQVKDKMAILLELQTFGVDQAIDSLIEEGKLTKSDEFGVEGLLGLTPHVRDEQYVATQLYQRINTPGDDWPIEEILADEDVVHDDGTVEPGLSEHQKEIIVHNMRTGGRVIVLSGSPGTGKTFCLGKILKYFRKRNRACAPTGKAAQRLTESLRNNGILSQATTIHRMLEPLPVEGGWAFQVNGKQGMYVEAEVVAIDESSMVNNWLAARTLQGIRPNTYIILVGDKNQLPPVGPGTMLRDLEELNFKPLTEIRRNSGQIVKTCAKIRDNQHFTIVPTKTPGLDPDKNNLQLVLAQKDEDKARKVEEIARNIKAGKLPTEVNGKRYVQDPTQDVQFLTATHRNPHVGRLELNKVLQNIFNPHGKGEHPVYRVGDKIICTENVRIKIAGKNTDQFIANGELGIVVESLPKQIIVRMNGDDTEYQINCGDDVGNGWDLGYCITCHKSQGSEWPLVIGVLGDDYGSKMVMSREWVYTAFSRASVCKIVVAIPSHIRNQVKKVRTWDRKSLILTHMENLDAHRQDESEVPACSN